MAPIIISIEGNIGAGKTTILDQLQEYMKDNKRVAFLREPVDVWEKIKDKKTGETVLQKFYANKEKYAFPFQVMAYSTRLSAIRNILKQDYDVIVCERSLEADKHIFAKMLHHDGLIDDVSFQIYNHFYQEYSEDCSLSAIVYIDADAEVCHRRVGKRSRTGESEISLEYLQKCKVYHDDWLCQTNTPVLGLNTNADVVYNKSDPNDVGMAWVHKIRTFIDEIQMNEDEHEEWKRR